MMPARVWAQSDAEPPGRLVDVDGRSMHISCQGSGSPTVVIDAGAGASSLGWLHIQKKIAPLTRTCVYDRAGLGWSESRAGARTSEQAARELRLLLSAANEPPPFALVGHSYGGYNVRVFHRLFSADVAGLALIDAAHEDQWERLPPVVRQLVDATLPGLRTLAAAAAEGKLRADSVPPHSFFARDPFLDRAYRAEMIEASHYQAYLGELEAMDISTAQVRLAGKVGTLPLVVLSSAREFDPFRNTPIPIEESNRIWLELQDELAALSTNSVHVISRTGPHTIHFAEPDVVAGVIRELVQRIRQTLTEQSLR